MKNKKEFKPVFWGNEGFILLKTPRTRKPIRKVVWEKSDYPWEIISRWDDIYSARENPPTEPGKYRLVQYEGTPGKSDGVQFETIEII